MTPINLVPQGCQEQRHRRQRCQGWLVALGAAGVVLLLAGLDLTLHQTRLHGLEAHRRQAEGRLADLQRERTLLLARRTTLFEQAKILIAPLDSSQVPAALAQLTHEAPAGVVLTRVEIGSGDQRGRVRPDAASPSEPGPPPVAIEGYAAHESLIHEFAGVVRQIPAWHSVKLHSIHRRDQAHGSYQHFTIRRDARVTP